MYKSIEERLEEAQKTIEALKHELKSATQTEKKITKRWRADRGDSYWLVSAIQGISRSIAGYDAYDSWRFSQGNYFRTKEQAEALAKWQRLHTALYDYSIKDGWKPDWSDEKQEKHYLLWWHSIDEVSVDSWNTLNYPSTVYFPNRDTALKAAKEVLGDDAKFYLTYNGFGG